MDLLQRAVSPCQLDGSEVESNRLDIDRLAGTKRRRAEVKLDTQRLVYAGSFPLQQRC